MAEAKAPHKEQRRYRRIRVNLSVIYRVEKPITIRMVVGNKEVRATMLDMGEGGISVLTNYNIPAKTMLTIIFTLFRVEDGDVIFYGPIEIIGEVRYAMPLGGNELRLGIGFKRLSKQDKFEIAQFVKLRNTETPLPP